MLVKTDGYLLEQQSPIQPCKTPRAILFILSNNGAPKGQIILKANFLVLICTKNRTKLFLISALASKMGQIKKTKALYYVN